MRATEESILLRDACSLIWSLGFAWFLRFDLKDSLFVLFASLLWMTFAVRTWPAHAPGEEGRAPVPRDGF